MDIPPVEFYCALAEIGFGAVAVEHHHTSDVYKICIHHRSIFLNAPGIGGDAVGVGACDGNAVCISGCVDHAAHILGSAAVEVDYITASAVHDDVLTCELEDFQNIASAVLDNQVNIFGSNIGGQRDLVLDADTSTQIQALIQLAALAFCVGGGTQVLKDGIEACVGLSMMCYTFGKEKRMCLGDFQLSGLMGKLLY